MDDRSREDAESELDGLTQVETCAAASKTYGCLGMSLTQGQRSMSIAELKRSTYKS